MRASYVYVITGQHATKVGISHDVYARLRDIERASGLFLQLERAWRFDDHAHARLVEREVHERLDAGRVIGEWFSHRLDAILETVETVACIPRRDLEIVAFPAAPPRSHRGGDRVSLIAGIDFSTFALDVALLDEDADTAQHQRIPLDYQPGGGLARIRRIRDVMPARGRWHDTVTAAGVELPYARKGGDILAYALGAILACLPADLDLRLIRSDDWRRGCQLPLRQPRADHKRSSLDFAATHWIDPPPLLDDNAADAFCIAWATRELLRPATHNREGAAR